jgi:XTP/dITP diphosphohydrolase
MKNLLIATGNPGKLMEIKDFMKGLPVETKGLADLGLVNDVEETGKTYEENAILKARYFYEKIKGAMPVLADDSGLIVDAIADELGVYTRRWGAGDKATDQEWLDYFLKRMEREENRQARFVCYAALYEGEKQIQVFCGEVRGQILRELGAPIKHGIPLSSVFLPDGFDKVFSAMTEAEKSQISHRGKAMAQVRNYLEK